MRIETGHTHLFPGCRLAVVEEGSEGQAVVLFSDGVAVQADLTRSEGGALLAMPAYRTGAGTVVAARCWRIAPQQATAAWQVVGPAD